MNEVIRIGTRSSKLALWQADWVKDKLQNHHPDLSFEIIPVRTTGDKNTDVPLSKIGDKGLFTKELDIALKERKIDIAVHSLKDVPTKISEGLTIGAVTKRWDMRDALISRENLSLQGLPQNALIATSSLRRTAQLLHFRSDFKIIDMRGNIPTRLRKFEESNWDAMVLAVAGIERLGLGDRITEKISPDVILPAVGQGSLAVMCRVDDGKTIELLRVINHVPSELATRAERAFLKTLEGGCQIPIGALGTVTDEQLHLTGCIGSLDGKTMVRDSLQGLLTQPENLGINLAARLLEMGGRKILNTIIKEQRS